MAVFRRVYKQHKNVPHNRDEKKDDKSTTMIAQQTDKRYSALHGDTGGAQRTVPITWSVKKRR